MLDVARDGAGSLGGGGLCQLLPHELPRGEHMLVSLSPAEEDSLLTLLTCLQGSVAVRVPVGCSCYVCHLFRFATC